MKGLFTPLPDETRKILEQLPALIDTVFPLPARYRSALPYDVAELSALLTSAREERSSSYLGKPALLSAYLRYFLPWNMYRLCRLFNSLPLELKPGDSVNDLGAGPLTLAASLWISRPDLRNIPLEFRCLDKTGSVLEAGRKLFAAIVELTYKNSGANLTSCPWTIRTIRSEIRRNGRLSAEIMGKPAILSAAVNVYNELFWAFSPYDTDENERFAENQARLLSTITDKSGYILVVEPGIPRSGEFISLLRFFLLKERRFPLSPCTHSGPCSFPGNSIRTNGRKTKWCHFAFDTTDAPSGLHKLSRAARLPKERAVLSFILAGPAPSGTEQNHEADETAAFRNKTAFGRNSVRNSGRSSDRGSGRSSDRGNSDRSNPVKIRILSDPFPVDSFPADSFSAYKNANSWGCYGCSEKGPVLVTGTREGIAASPSGTIEELALVPGMKDGKSGALVAER